MPLLAAAFEDSALAMMERAVVGHARTTRDALDRIARIRKSRDTLLVGGRVHKPKWDVRIGMLDPYINVPSHVFEPPFPRPSELVKAA